MHYKNNILQYFGNIHASYLHAKGRRATDILITLLDCKKGENILEFGCGAVASITDLAAMFAHTTF